MGHDDQEEEGEWELETASALPGLLVFSKNMSGLWRETSTSSAPATEQWGSWCRCWLLFGRETPSWAPPAGSSAEGDPPNTTWRSPGRFQHTWSSRGEGRRDLPLPPGAPPVWTSASPSPRRVDDDAKLSLVHLGSGAHTSITKLELSLARTGPAFAIPPKQTTSVESSRSKTREWPILAGTRNPPRDAASNLRQRSGKDAPPTSLWAAEGCCCCCCCEGEGLSTWSTRAT